MTFESDILLKLSCKELRKLSDENLAKHIAYFKPSAPVHILGELEFKRRMSSPGEMRGWAALFVSIAALCLSIYAILGRHHI